MNQPSLKHKWISQNFIFCLKVATNNIHIKIKKIHRVVEDGCIWEGRSLTLMNVCWVSQSVLKEVLNTAGDDVFLKENDYW